MKFTPPPFNPAMDQYERQEKANASRKVQVREGFTVPPGLFSILAEAMGRFGKRGAYFHTCLNCEHWGRVKEEIEGDHCKKFNQLPPPSVIVDGCEYWEDFEIPFKMALPLVA